MSHDPQAQARIATLYVERNQRYDRLPARRTILNLGCGSGSFPKRYGHPHCLIFNVDHGEEVAGYPAYGPQNRGFARFMQLDPDPRCINLKMDIFEMHRFPSGVFDMVVCGQLVEHFDTKDLEWILHECHRVLGPVARAGAQALGELQIDTITQRLGEDMEEHKQNFTADSLQELVTRMGFNGHVEEFADGTALWGTFLKAVKA